LNSQTVARTDNVSLSGDSSALQRKGDGSFAGHLEEAEKKISNNSSVLIAPWAQVEKLFDILPLKFDFNLSVESTPKISQKEAQNYPSTPPAKNSENSKEKSDNIPQAIAEQIQNKVAKSILSNKTPSPQIAIGYAPFQLSGETPKQISKTEMQSIIDEMIEKVEFLKAGQRREIKLALSPETLGNLMLSLSIKNGLVSIQIAASSESKKTLEDNLSELEISLKEAKIELEEIKIVEVKNDSHADNAA